MCLKVKLRNKINLLVNFKFLRGLIRKKIKIRILTLNSLNKYKVGKLFHFLKVQEIEKFKINLKTTISSTIP